MSLYKLVFTLVCTDHPAILSRYIFVLDSLIIIILKLLSYLIKIFLRSHPFVPSHPSYISHPYIFYKSSFNQLIHSSHPSISFISILSIQFWPFHPNHPILKLSIQIIPSLKLTHIFVTSKFQPIFLSYIYVCTTGYASISNLLKLRKQYFRSLNSSYTLTRGCPICVHYYMCLFFTLLCVSPYQCVFSLYCVFIHFNVSLSPLFCFCVISRVFGQYNLCLDNITCVWTI